MTGEPYVIHFDAKPQNAPHLNVQQVATPPSAPINFTGASNSYRVLSHKIVFPSAPTARLAVPGIFSPLARFRSQGAIKFIEQQQQPGQRSRRIRVERVANQGCA